MCVLQAIQHRRRVLIPVPTVPEASARFEGASENLPLPVNHSGLNKYASSKSPGYASVKNQIMALLSAAQDHRKAELSARHMVPAWPVSTYTERKALKNELVTCINEKPALGYLANAVAVVGAGGMGKTQLVLSYIKDFGHQYDAILWVDARTRQSARASFRAYCNALSITIPNTTHGVGSLGDEPEVRAILHWLSGRIHPGEDWLMVVDNADDLQFGLSHIVPQGHKGTVIITSRDTASVQLLGHRTRCVDVDSMTAVEGETLLLTGLGYDSSMLDVQISVLAREIAEVLGQMALAISLATAYIKASMKTDVLTALHQYLRDYHRHRDALLSRTTHYALGQHELTVSTVWDASINMVKACSERARLPSSELLTFLTLLNFQNVQEDLFRFAALGMVNIRSVLCGGEMNIPPWLLQLLACDTTDPWDSFHFRDTMHLLTRFSLVRATRGPFAGVSMHDLIRWRAEQERRPEYPWERWNVIFLTTICYHLTTSTDADAARFRPHLLPHLPSTAYIRAALKGVSKAQKSFVFHYMGLMWAQQERLSDSITHLTCAVRLAAGAHGLDHPDTLISISHLASTYNKMGRSDKALSLQQQVVGRYEATLGNANPATLRARAVLAAIYRHKALDESALEQHRLVYTNMQVTLGTLHPHTLAAAMNLAGSHRDLRYYDHAAELQAQVLQDRKIVLGPEHHDTLNSMSQLAVTLWCQGRDKEAQVLQAQCLRISTEQLGESSPLALRSKTNLSAIVLSLGQHAKAERLALETYATAEQVFGASHPETLEMLKDLGITLLGIGKFTESREALEQALVPLRDMYGSEHWMTREVADAIERCDARIESKMAVPRQSTVPDTDASA